MSKTPTCNFNCICINSDCSFRHYISYKERKNVEKIYKNIPDIKTMLNEDKTESRKANCTYGQLCRNKDCGFKHRLNVEGRFKIIDKYDNMKSVQTEPIRKVKEIKVVVDNKLSTKNLFEMLEDYEEKEEIEVVPEKVVPEKVVEKDTWEDKIKWSEIVKGKGLEIKFEKIMKMETKTNWADYDSD